MQIAHADAGDVGTATGVQLMKQLQATGQHETAINLAQHMADQGLARGRANLQELG